jgi:hypothetical protein
MKNIPRKPKWTKARLRKRIQQMRKEIGSAFSPMYNPTGQSSKEFLHERGRIPTPKPEKIRLLRGGAPAFGKPECVNNSISG